MNKLSRFYIFLAVGCSSFLATYTGSAVNVCLHDLGIDLDLSPSQLSYVVGAYSVCTAVLLLIFGKLSDLWGRKKVFVTGTSIFLVANLLAASASTGWLLIASRALAGIGAAMFFSNNMAILASVFEPDQRGKVLGAMVALAYLGTSLGPVIGGALTEFLGWRSVFLSVALVSLGVTALGVWKLPPEKTEKVLDPFDFSGAFYYVTGLVMFIVGLGLLPKNIGLVFLAGSLILGYFFFYRQRTYSNPLLDLSLFGKNRIFLAANMASLIHYIITFSVAFWLGIFLQHNQIKHLDAYTTGMVLLAQPIVQVILSPVAGTLADRFDPALVASIGMVATCGCLLCFALLSPTAPLVWIVANLMLLGVGFAFFVTPNNSSSINSVDSKAYSIASSIIATGRMLGMAISMALTSLIFNLFPRERSAITFLSSFHWAFAIFFSLGIIGFFVSLTGVKSLSIRKLSERKEANL